MVTWRARWPEAANSGGGISDHVRRSEVEECEVLIGVLLCILFVEFANTISVSVRNGKREVCVRCEV